MFVCLYVCYAIFPRCFAHRASHFTGFTYDHTDGSSKKNIFHSPCYYLFLRTIEWSFIVITYNWPQRDANNYVQLLTRSCVFSSIKQDCHTTLQVPGGKWTRKLIVNPTILSSMHNPPLSDICKFYFKMYVLLLLSAFCLQATFLSS